MWDGVMRLAIWGTAVLVVAILLRFLVLWSRLGALLEEITRVPMVGAFERLPYEVSRLFGGYLYSQRPHHTQLAAAAWALPPAVRQRLLEEMTRKRRSLLWVFGRPTPADPPAPPASPADLYPDLDALKDDETWLRLWLGRYADDTLRALPRWWVTRPIDDAFGAGDPEGKGKGASPDGGPRPPTRVGVRAAPPAGVVVELSEGRPPPNSDARVEQEHFVACYVVMYLGPYFAQLRMLVYALATAAPLLLLAAASYPFQPDRPRLDAVAALLIAVVVGIVYVLYKINRDGLVSRISRTTPNRFTPDTGFLRSLGQYVLPIVLVLVAQLFGLFRFILEPILGLLQ